MKCFYHQDRDAVGSCRSCFKGLCSVCAVDLGKGLACRDRCEADAQALIAATGAHAKLVTTAPTMLNSAYRSTAWAGSGFLLLGVFFLAWGLLNQPADGFSVLFGSCSFAFGLLSILWVLARAPAAVEQEARPALGGVAPNEDMQPTRPV
jgi:hypothetical protein